MLEPAILVSDIVRVSPFHTFQLVLDDLLVPRLGMDASRGRGFLDCGSTFSGSVPNVHFINGKLFVMDVSRLPLSLSLNA